MGNRAVITTAPYSDSNVGIYVHWNGGRASVEGFLLACKRLGFRSPQSDPSYALARLAQAIATYFGNDGLSVGVARCGDLDTRNGDNGTYLIGGDWEIVGRKYAPSVEEAGALKTGQIAYVICRRLKAADEVEHGVDPEVAEAWLENSEA